MDLTILNVVAVATLAVAFYYLGTKAKKRWDIDSILIILGIDALESIVPFVKALTEKLDVDQDKVQKIIDIAVDTLEYMRTIQGEDKDEIIEAGITYATELCMAFDIEVDDKMEVVINAVVRASHFIIDYFDNDKNKGVTVAAETIDINC